MRDDMHELVIERPRWGHAEDNASVHRDRCRLRSCRAHDRLDDLGRRAPMRPRTGFRKSLSDNLAPLRRFLARRVGRKWDDVYAELCAGLSPDSLLQRHVLDHVWDFVALHVDVDAQGRLWDRERPWLCVSDRRHGLYVDPTTGRLRRPRRVPPGPPWTVQQACTLDGLRYVRGGPEGRAARWYMVTLGQDDGLDALFGMRSMHVPSGQQALAYGAPDRRAVTAVLLSRRDVRDLGLP